MGLTKRQRYLFGMDSDPGEIYNKLALLRKISGMIILPVIAYLLGQALARGYEPFFWPFWQWWREVILESGLMVFPYMVIVALGSVCLSSLFRSLYWLFDIKTYMLVILLCALLVTAPITVRVVTEGGDPLTLLYLFIAMLIQLGELDTDDDKTPAILAAIGRVNNESDLAAIVLESRHSEIARAALMRISDPVELRRIVLNETFVGTMSSSVGTRLIRQTADKDLLLEIAEKTRSTEIRLCACQKLGHVFDDAGTCCRRCGANPDDREHDWADGICKRCGTVKPPEKHKCGACDGSGFVEEYSCESGNGGNWLAPCGRCNGTGYLYRRQG